MSKSSAKKEKSGKKIALKSLKEKRAAKKEKLKDKKKITIE